MDNKSAPLQNRRHDDIAPDSRSDVLARRFLKVMVALIITGGLATICKFLDWDVAAWYLAGAALLVFIWLVVTIIQLDNALFNEIDKDNDNLPPPPPVPA